MESDWCKNVWIWGMGCMGFTRCAQLHDFFPYFLTNYPEPSGFGSALVVEYPVHGDIERYGFSSVLKVAGHPNFPYGLDVD